MAGLNHQVRGELDHSHRCAPPRARSFQIIPIKMKRAISVRKVTLIMATVRNASPAGRGVIDASRVAKPRSQEPNSPTLGNVSVPSRAAIGN